jgi:hypothetical protein
MRIRLVGFLAIPLLVVVLPMRTQAQVGGLINRAKQAVVDDNKTVNNPQLGEPFDAASLDGAIKGMKLYRSRLAEVAALQKQYLDAQQKRSALVDKNQKQLNDYDESRNKNRECVSNFNRATRPQREAAMQQKMMTLVSDPKFAAEMARIGQAQQAAYAKGDTAAVRKLAEEQVKLYGIDEKADSVAAAAKCPMPPPPAAVAEIERLGKQSDDLNTRIRTAESSADVDGARAAGVQPARFQQMRERLTTWVSKPSSLGSKEGNLLNGRKKEIEDVVKTP